MGIGSGSGAGSGSGIGCGWGKGVVCLTKITFSGSSGARATSQLQQSLQHPHFSHR